MPTTLRVHASYHQYNLFETDADDTPDDGTPGNGLVQVNADGDYVTVNTGIQDGYLDLGYEVFDQEPPLDTTGWDEVVDISARFAPPGAGITSPDGDGDYEKYLPDGETYGITLPGPDAEPHWWRIRIHARGRDNGLHKAFVDPEAGDDVTEQHLLHIWTAPPAAEERHKLTDQVGEKFRTGR
ncbi:hypothetical protein [Streptomyces luteireticuli]|uniref:hypothetical protein n=1 Tax=Streptomyces luteireticuli TaxID=173858 RepID=UPI003556CAE9